MNWSRRAVTGGLVRPANARVSSAGHVAGVVVATLAVAIGLLALPACDKPRVVADPAGKGPPPVPVTVALASQKDTPVRIQAIARAEPYRTLTVRPQVGGQITTVHFDEGDDVQAGDLLYSLDARPYETALRQAEGVLAKDTALAQNAAIEAQWQTELHNRGSASQREYETALANLAALEGTVHADRAALENARLQLEYCAIRAPIDGRTGRHLVVVGSVVKPNDTDLVVLNQLTPIYVTFSVAEELLEQIRQYQAVKPLLVEAEIPQFIGPPERGELTFIDNQVDGTTAMITLKGTFANPRQRLWPGQSLNAILTLTTRPQAVVVPAQAVQIGQTGPFVYVVNADETVEARPVEPGVTLDGETVIEKGVAAGERLVTDGHLRLKPGAKIEIKKKAGATSAPGGATSKPASGPTSQEGRR